ncbi:MAG: transaldolase [Phycisphaerae bacterium]
MLNTIERLSGAGQSIWCDSISRPMIDSGTLQRLIDVGVVGVTSNPTIFMNAITAGDGYEARISALTATGTTGMAAYESVVLRDIMDAADILQPVYHMTQGADGFVSLEVNPKLAYDTDATIAEARRLFAAINRPNVLIKVPATAEGIPAIEALIAAGINVNVTLIFSLDMYERVAHAYLAGLQRRHAAGGDISHVASVASFFVSRVDTLTDKLLEDKIAERSADPHPDGVGAPAPTDTDEDDAPPPDPGYLLGQAGIANARLAYARFEQLFDDDGPFGPLADAGARVQRPLWASTSTKNPDLPDTLYVDALVGPNTVNTLPPATIDAVLDHGATAVMIRDELDTARAMIDDLGRFGIDFADVTDQLLADGVDLFARSFDRLLATLHDRQQRPSAV